jgi:sterol desaturase/sphingolipid hydroxylase (fatty acid hydroxylase superfamily)
VFVKAWLKLTEYVWPKLILFQTNYMVSDMNFILLFGVATTALTLTTGFILFGIIYYCKIPFFEKYKALEEPWPWESDPTAWNQLKWRSIKFSLFNLFVIAPTMNLIPALFSMKITNKMDFEYPSEYQLTASILFCSLMEDLCFYCSHSTLHRPVFYSWIHKYHHEHKVPTVLASIHAHPIEFYFGNVVP